MRRGRDIVVIGVLYSLFGAAANLSGGTAIQHTAHYRHVGIAEHATLPDTGSN